MAERDNYGRRRFSNSFKSRRKPRIIKQKQVANAAVTDAAINSNIVQNKVKAISVAALTGKATSANVNEINDIFNVLLNIG